MKHYPINLNAENIKALVIGAGAVGMRKIETLLAQNVPSICVIDTNLAYEDFKYKDNVHVEFHSREFRNSDLDNCNLIFIATDNKDFNSKIVEICNKHNILCNVVTNPHEGDFTLPALIQKDDLLVTISTQGLSPALSRALKEDIEVFLDSGYSGLCAFLGKLRPFILDLDLASDLNKEIFSFFIEEKQKEILLQIFSRNATINISQVELLKKQLNIKLEKFLSNSIQYIDASSLSMKVQAIIEEVME